MEYSESVCQSSDNFKRDSVSAKCRFQKEKKERSNRLFRNMDINSKEYDSSSSIDESYTGGRRALPTTTGEWDFFCLESVGIHYNNYFHKLPTDILDIIYAKTGMFGPLTEKQKCFAKSLQDGINFSCSVMEILGIGFDLNVEAFIPEMEKDIENNKPPSSNALNEVPTAVEDFIHRTIIMMKYQSSYNNDVYKFGKCQIPPVPEDIFIDVFKAFTKMCSLLPIPGSAWRSYMSVHGIDVTSATDVVIMTKDHLSCTVPDTSSVVSISKVKHLGSYTNNDNDDEPSTKPHSNATYSSDLGESHDSEPSVYEKPAILRRVQQTILGQHGGELILHQSLYQKTQNEDRSIRYILGMIVIGTEITFTLLVLHGQHLAELRTKNENKRHKSFIYYSEPRDLLKKEDRDVLIESFIRLNNKK